MSAESETVVDGRGRCSRHKNRWGRGDKEHEWVREGGRGAEGLCISGVRNCCQLIRVLQMAQAYLHRQQAAICLQWSDALSTYHVLHSSLYLWRITLPKLLLLLQGHRKWSLLMSNLKWMKGTSCGELCIAFYSIYLFWKWMKDTAKALLEASQNDALILHPKRKFICEIKVKTWQKSSVCTFQMNAIPLNLLFIKES